MKTIYTTLLLVLLPFLGFAQHLSGKLDASIANNIEITDRGLYDENVGTVIVDEDGSFAFHYQSKQPTILDLHIADTLIPVFLKPKDSVYLAISPTGIEEVKESQDMEAFIAMRKQFPWYEKLNQHPSNSDMEDFASKSAEYRKEQEALLKSLSEKHQLSEEYLAFEKHHIAYQEAQIADYYQTFYKPGFYERDKKTPNRYNWDFSAMKKRLKALMPQYPTKTTYAYPALSMAYRQYASSILFSLSNIGKLTELRGNSDATSEQTLLALQEYYDATTAEYMVLSHLRLYKKDLASTIRNSKRLGIGLQTPAIKKAVSDLQLAAEQESGVSEEFVLPMEILPNEMGKSEELSAWLEEQKGQVIFLEFWSMNCRACRAGIPDMRLLQKRLEEKGVKFLFVYVGNGNEKEEWLKFVNEHQMGGTHVFSTSRNLLKDHKVQALPTYWFFDKDGTLVEDNKSKGYYEQLLGLLGK